MEIMIRIQIMHSIRDRYDLLAASTADTFFGCLGGPDGLLMTVAVPFFLGAAGLSICEAGLSIFAEVGAGVPWVEDSPVEAGPAAFLVLPWVFSFSEIVIIIPSATVLSSPEPKVVSFFSTCFLADFLGAMLLELSSFGGFGFLPRSSASRDS